MNKQKVTILYERLSVEDDRDTESQSIENQRNILQEYAERSGLIPYQHICDDGYSGTNWLRPGWQQVLSMVDAGEVACICIKDLSRMSRDYLHAGLDRQTFLEKGVRLIALNDNYDNSRGEDDFTPFKEIILNSREIRYQDITKRTNLFHFFSRFTNDQILIKNLTHKICHFGQSSLDGKFILQDFAQAKIDDK